MIKLTVINIYRSNVGILDLKKRFDIKLLKHINCKQRFAENCLEVYENCSDYISNNLRLNEIAILMFFQFYCKINRNQLEIAAEKTYSLNRY